MKVVFAFTMSAFIRLNYVAHCKKDNYDGIKIENHGLDIINVTETNRSYSSIEGEVVPPERKSQLDKVFDNFENEFENKRRRKAYDSPMQTLILTILATLCLVVFFIYLVWLIFDHFKSQIDNKAGEEAMKEIQQHTRANGRGEKYKEPQNQHSN